MELPQMEYLNDLITITITITIPERVMAKSQLTALYSNLSIKVE